jgi:hypothetical protein
MLVEGRWYAINYMSDSFWRQAEDFSGYRRIPFTVAESFPRR